MEKESYIKAEMERFEAILRRQIEVKEALIGYRFIDKNRIITVVPALISQGRMDDGEMKESDFLKLMGVPNGAEYNRTIEKQKRRKIKKSKRNEEGKE